MNSKDTLGVILAGGSSRRMGISDKFFLEFKGKSLLQHSIDRAEPQVDRLIISANDHLEQFKAYGFEVITDGSRQHNGPLAGIISAMSWVKINKFDYKWLMSFASDTPHFPTNCVKQLKSLAESNNLEAVTCVSSGHNHYTFTLWSINTLPQLTTALDKGQRALRTALSSLNHGLLELDDDNNPFFNINTPEEWVKFNQTNHNP